MTSVRLLEFRAKKRLFQLRLYLLDMAFKICSAGPKYNMLMRKKINDEKNGNLGGLNSRSSDGSSSCYHCATEIAYQQRSVIEFIVLSVELPGIPKRIYRLLFNACLRASVSAPLDGAPKGRLTWLENNRCQYFK